jgi:membrane protein DedA with SNARE-associated domain
MIASLFAWVTSLIGGGTAIGYAIVGGLVFAEDALLLGFVIPGETAAVFGGMLASQGTLDIVATIGIVAGSAFLGDTVGYIIGRRFGPRLLQSRILRPYAKRIDGVADFVRRRGAVAVITGRFTAFLRATTPTIAGMSRMHPWRFMTANAAGALAWGILFPLVGFFGGTALQAIVGRSAGWVAVGVLAAIAIVSVVRHLVRRRRRAATEAGILSR